MTCNIKVRLCGTSTRQKIKEILNRNQMIRWSRSQNGSTLQLGVDQPSTRPKFSISSPHNCIRLLFQLLNLECRNLHVCVHTVLYTGFTSNVSNLQHWASWINIEQRTTYQVTRKLCLKKFKTHEEATLRGTRL